MSRLYLISYDIREPKRLRRVYRTMRGFGEHTQYSIFVCALTPTRRALLEGRLAAIIRGDDQVLFVDLGPDGEHARARITSMGKALATAPTQAIII